MAEPGAARAILLGSRAAYGSVIFSGRREASVLALLATMTVPEIGACGLLAVGLGNCVAWAVGFDRDAIRVGVHGYNPLLVGLFAGAMVDPFSTALLLAAVFALPTVLLHAALASALVSAWRLPPLSLPFLAVAWALTALLPTLRGGGPTIIPPPSWLDWHAPGLPGELLSALGAVFAVPRPAAGAFIGLALLVASRISAVHALTGLAAAWLVATHLLALPPGWLAGWGGFNAVLVAVALGGTFFVPSPASLGLAALGATTCAVLDAAVARPLAVLSLPPLVVSMNTVVLGSILAMRSRVISREPRLVDVVRASPEESLHHFRTRVERFRAALPVRLRLPFRGPWLVTQGHDGAHTHQGPQRFGLDFEVVTQQGARHQGDGSKAADWLCYKLPVLAPAAGTVVRVIDGLPDNPITQVDTVQPYGNLVILNHAPGLYSVLAHLSPGSIEVQEGESVLEGRVLGKVGNSGRSPVPHLHVQVQASPEVGAPSIPLEFTDVVSEAVGRLSALAVPQEGERLRNVVRAESMAQSLLPPPGRRIRARVTAGGRDREEILHSEVDALGYRSLHSPARGARLWFGDERGSAVIYDHQGPRDGALFALYAALARVPLEDRGGLCWEDRLDPHRLGSLPAEWVRDLLAALVPPARQLFRYRSREEGRDVVIQGEAGGRFFHPVRTEAVIRPGEGVRRLFVQVGERRIDVVLAPDP